MSNPHNPVTNMQMDSASGESIVQESTGGSSHVLEKPTKSFSIVSGAYLYEGYAAWGSATSSSVWQMFRSPVAGGATQRVDGGAYSQIADNYASLTYAD